MSCQQHLFAEFSLGDADLRLVILLTHFQKPQLSAPLKRVAAMFGFGAVLHRSVVPLPLTLPRPYNAKCFLQVQQLRWVMCRLEISVGRGSACKEELVVLKIAEKMTARRSVFIVF